tara:strand:- start:238 stop:417 length:180 start_codon:yes stop_codon:yes gene_type:complete
LFGDNYENDCFCFTNFRRKIALPKFTDHLADLHGKGIFKEENLEKMLAEKIYDSQDEKM